MRTVAGRSEPDLDVLVVGSGVAGLSVAIELAGQCRLAVVAKESGGGGSTILAQGGIAAALAEEDCPEDHALDTVAAAAGLGDPAVARIVTEEASEAVERLASFGAQFDRGALAREGGHGRARVAHARGDATGAEISRALMAAASQRGVPVIEAMFFVDLLTDRVGGAVRGALLWDGAAGHLREVSARTVVLATGGYGQLWACTTSPVACSGDGLAAAVRAGAQVADLEMVQFHPTGMDLGRDPRPLASEALRGAGARLRDATGRYLSELASDDLAPRDVVSRAMARRMAELGADHSLLDATELGRGLERRFPTFWGACRDAGLDPSRQWVPVSPTAHYTMGGVLADVDGRSTLPGLMAVGEVASSGLHGANRLASNSLLEGAVVGRRAAEVILSSGGQVDAREGVVVDEVLDMGTAATASTAGTGPGVHGRQQLRRAMQAFAGVSRDAPALSRLAALLSPMHQSGHDGGPTSWELANMTLIARGVVGMALRRRESRGAHWRTDYPTAHADWRVRQVAQRAPSGEGFLVGNMKVEPPQAQRDGRSSSAAAAAAVP